MARCKTCKIKLGREGDDWCAHCWPAAIDRENKRLKKSAQSDTPNVNVAPPGGGPIDMGARG